MTIEPTVALVEEDETVVEEPVTQDFDQELAEIEAEEEKAVEGEADAWCPSRSR